MIIKRIELDSLIWDRAKLESLAEACRGKYPDATFEIELHSLRTYAFVPVEYEELIKYLEEYKYG